MPMEYDKINLELLHAVNSDFECKHSNIRVKIEQGGEEFEYEFNKMEAESIFTLVRDLIKAQVEKRYKDHEKEGKYPYQVTGNKMKYNWQDELDYVDKSYSVLIWARSKKEAEELGGTYIKVAFCESDDEHVEVTSAKKITLERYMAGGFYE